MSLRTSWMRLSLKQSSIKSFQCFTFFCRMVDTNSKYFTANCTNMNCSIRTDKTLITRSIVEIKTRCNIWRQSGTSDCDQFIFEIISHTEKGSFKKFTHFRSAKMFQFYVKNFCLFDNPIILPSWFFCLFAQIEESGFDTRSMMAKWWYYCEKIKIPYPRK